MNTSSDPEKKKASSQNSRNSTGNGESGSAKRSPGLTEVLRIACSQLAELTGMTAESVSSFEQTEDGWTLEVEVLELTRVPDTMSLLASYRVECDPQGELRGYRRVRRYERGRADGSKAGGR
ncbi:gas vesicle protein [Streptomyces sp. NPDC050147]|uniref:gas vesicle protein GvpO n=1 Tax=Streptomyces sp. NPDC050147 TaxID=3155513 RepID=UPI0034322AED